MSRLFELQKELMSGRRPASEHPLQRPGSLYIPGLRAQPWYDPAEFPWVRELESHAPEIRAEALALREEQAGFLPYVEPSPPPPGQKHWGRRRLNDRGDWDVFYFDVLGRAFDENRRRCPKTVEAISRVPRRTTSAFYSALGGSAHIPAHTGPTNAFLRVHLGLVVPTGCVMRVGAEARSWEEGKCSIFDDSFDHEVWNRSQKTRIVLIFYIYHPDFSDEEVEQLGALRERVAIDEDRAMNELADDMIRGRFPFVVAR
jgi:aspartyl/asparaginyl beta-hydroxylase (cupin superfamily)